jgi:hypothetical protein
MGYAPGTRVGPLAFSRWGVEANHGRIYTRSLPDTRVYFHRRPAATIRARCCHRIAGLAWKARAICRPTALPTPFT